MNNLPHLHLHIHESSSDTANASWPAVMSFPQRHRDKLFLPEPKHVVFIPNLWFWLEVMRQAKLWQPTIH